MDRPKIFKETKVKNFISYVERHFQARETDIQKALYSEMENQKSFYNDTLSDEEIVDKVIFLGKAWLYEPRKTIIKPEDLIYYRIAALYFLSIKRK